MDACRGLTACLAGALCLGRAVTLCLGQRAGSWQSEAAVVCLQ